ncbi:MAG: sortase [Lachnospiraceae bacterium]|nr:sortase [Lachnospiraceae bacterium]
MKNKRVNDQKQNKRVDDRKQSKSVNGRNRKRKGTFWITIGLLLIAAAFFLTVYNLYDNLRAEQSAGQVIDQLKDGLFPDGTADSDGETGIPSYVLCPEMEMPVETVNGMEIVGVLQIPALELELPVISQWSYPSLKKAPCRYSGSAYLNNLVICGHNYASHFGSLKKLSEGDQAVFTDMDGKVFTYRMVERETLLPDSPSSIEEMESGDWDLTLFTCTTGGKSRVTVRFELEGN